MSNPTFADFDKFDHKKFADNLTKVISKCHPLYDEASVLSLNARFGSGKTTFLKMWETQLKEDGYQVIYINSWEQDFADDPLLHIVSTLLDELEHQEEALKKSLKAALVTAGDVLDNLLKEQTGVSVKEIKSTYQENADEAKLSALGEKIYEAYSYKKKVYKKLNVSLSQYVNSLEKKPLIIMVDELDRARPDYAVRFLEAIKHIFAVKGVCFVLAVDRAQLEKSVKQLYGAIDFENYYRRFVTREANLPDPSSMRRKEFINFMYSRYFINKAASKDIFFPLRQDDVSKIKDYLTLITPAFGLNGREMESFFRNFSEFLALYEDPQNDLSYAYILATAILLSIHIKDALLYKKLGQETANYDDIKKFFDGLNLQDRNLKEHFIFNFLAFCLVEGKDNIWIIDLAKPLADNRNVNEHELTLYAKIRLETKSLFGKVYTRFEAWRPFIKS